MTDYFSALESELFEAAERQRDDARTASGAAGQSKRHLRPRVIGLALGLTLLAGVPAAAVTGVFRPHREPDGLVRLTERRVVADGSLRDGRRWQLLASQSGYGFCFGIRLPNPGPPGLGDLGASVSEGCGGKTPGELTVATSSGGTFAKNAVAFGLAPDAATHVRVEAQGVTATVATVDDNIGLPGRLYVIDLPTRKALRSTTAIALDAQGKEVTQTSL